MNIDRIATYGLWLLCAIFALVSALCLIDPTVLLGAMEIGLESPTALAEVRAGYSGTFAGLAMLFAQGARRADYRSNALGIGALVLGVFTFGRLLSLALDGTPNALAFVNHGLEALGFVLALWLWRATKHTPSGDGASAPS